MSAENLSNNLESLTKKWICRAAGFSLRRPPLRMISKAPVEASAKSGGAFIDSAGGDIVKYIFDFVVAKRERL